MNAIGHLVPRRSGSGSRTLGPVGPDQPERYVNKEGVMEAAVGQSGRVGPKKPTTEKKAVCASQHPIVTETMLSVMQRGGNAVDAAIAGCLVQATVQQEMTNHTGTVTFLMWEASSGRIHELNSMGTIVPDMKPFRRSPPAPGPASPVSGWHLSVDAAFAV